MKPGRFDEQPMPETTRTLWGGMPSSRMASFRDFKTPKSPHPGHQSGWTSPSRLCRVNSAVAMMCLLPLRRHGAGSRLDSGQLQAIHGAGVHSDHELSFGSAVRPVHELHLPDRLAVLPPVGPLETGGARPLLEVDADVVVGHLPRFVVLDSEVHRLPRYEVLDPPDDVGGLEGLAVVPGEDVIDAEAALRPEMAGELAGEVVLDHDRPFAALQDRLGLRAVEGMDVLEVELVGLEARPGELVRGFLDDAPGGAPPDQGDLGRGGAFQDGRLQPGAHAVHLPHPLLVHLAADRGVGVLVADQDALLVVVVRPRHVDQARAAGSSPRRDPRGSEGVALVAPVQGRFGGERGDPLSPFDRNLARDGLRVDRGAMLSQEEIGDQDDGELEGLREVEGFYGGVEAVEGVLHRDDDARIVALRGPEGLVQVALLGLGGNAGGGPPPLDVDDDHRSLDHARHPDGLGHEREASPGGGAHGPDPGVPGPDGEIDHGQLVLGLLDEDAALLAVRGEPVEDERGRAHGVGGVELAARGHRPQRDHLVPRHHGAAVFCMTAGSLPSLVVISVTGRGRSATPSGTSEGSQWSLLPLKMIAPPASTSRAWRSMPSWLRATSTFRWSPWLSTFSSESRSRSQVWPPRISDW